MRNRKAAQNSPYEVTCVQLPQQSLYGLHQPSNDRTQARDIPRLSAMLEAKAGDILPLYVVSKDYKADNGDFTLFLGGEAQAAELEAEVLPGGIYARLEIRPRFRFLWGAAVGAAKRWFYTQWLPASPYEAVNLEYELHTETAMGKHPTASLFFAIRKKAEAEPLAK